MHNGAASSGHRRRTDYVPYAPNAEIRSPDSRKADGSDHGISKKLAGSGSACAQRVDPAPLKLAASNTIPVASNRKDAFKGVDPGHCSEKQWRIGNGSPDYKRAAPRHESETPPRTARTLRAWPQQRKIRQEEPCGKQAHELLTRTAAL